MITTRVAVRRAALGDLATIVALRIALLREYGDHPLYGRLRADAESRAMELYRTQVLSPFEAIFLAEIDGEVAGILRCVDSPGSPLLEPERYGYISSVYVRPEHRRRGVLRELLATAADWCEHRGVHEVRLHNAPASPHAEPAWNALGFDVVEHVRYRALDDAHPPKRD